MPILRADDSTRVRASLRGLLPAATTLLVLLLGGAVLGSILDTVGDGTPTTVALFALIAQTVLYGGLVGLAIWCGTRLERRQYTAFGLNVDSGWLLNFVAGTTITVVAIVLSLWWAEIRGLRNVDLSAAAVSGPGEPLVPLVVFAVYIGYSLVGHVFEEVVYRRIMIRNFTEGLTARGFTPVAAVVPATVGGLLLFGLYHVPLRGNFVAAIDSALLGVAFALAYLLTGELGLPVGVHFGRQLIGFAFGKEVVEFEFVAVLELTRNTLSANLEVKLVRLGLACLLILAWVFLREGEIRLAETVYSDGSEVG